MFDIISTKNTRSEGFFDSLLWDACRFQIDFTRRPRYVGCQSNEQFSVISSLFLDFLYAFSQTYYEYAAAYTV